MIEIKDKLKLVYWSLFWSHDGKCVDVILLLKHCFIYPIKVFYLSDYLI